MLLLTRFARSAATRIKAWKSWNQWKVLFLCLVLYSWLFQLYSHLGLELGKYWNTAITKKCSYGCSNEYGRRETSNVLFLQKRNSKCTSSPSSLLEVPCLLEMLSLFEMLYFLEVLCLLEVPRLLEMLCFLEVLWLLTLRCIAYLVCFPYLSCFPHFRCFTYLRGNLFKTLRFSRVILGKSLWKSLLFNK